MALRAIAAAALAATVVLAAPPRVILYVLGDDIGWGSLGFVSDFARTAGPNGTSLTPNLDALAAEGTVMASHIAHFMCTPSRVSLLSGRLPVWVQQGQADPETPNAGMPRNMTCFAEKLSSAGYSTHYAGKWDAGIATPDHTPQGRGFSTSLSFAEHMVDSWTQTVFSGGTVCNLVDPNIKDLWDTDGPARTLNGTAHVEQLFSDRIMSILNASDPIDGQPLMLLWAPKSMHYPLEVPQSQFDLYSWVTDDEPDCNATAPVIWPGQTTGYSCRRQGWALLGMMDTALGNMVSLIKSRGWWNDTLVVFSSDNGAPLDVSEAAGGNYPLLGGKYANWQGGVSVPAIVSGGYLPAAVRGTVNNGFAHIADWYATLLGLVGADPFDKKAAAAGLPPVNSVDLWPMISGQNLTSPRQEVPISPGAIIQWPYKLVTGWNWWSGRSGAVYPNASSPDMSPDVWRNCGNGCLFDLSQDWVEQNDISGSNPDIVTNLNNRLNELVPTFWQNNDTGINNCPQNITMLCGCWAAINTWGGFLGPFQL